MEFDELICATFMCIAYLLVFLHAYALDKLRARINTLENQSTTSDINAENIIELKCPSCNEEDDILINEASWLQDAMESWNCAKCNASFTVEYTVDIEKITIDGFNLSG